MRLLSQDFCEVGDIRIVVVILQVVEYDSIFDEGSHVSLTPWIEAKGTLISFKGAMISSM